MEDDTTSTPLFGAPLRIIVFGPASFVDMIAAQQTPVVRGSVPTDDVDTEQRVDSNDS